MAIVTMLHTSRIPHHAQNKLIESSLLQTVLTEALAVLDDAVEAGEVAELVERLRGRVQQRPRALDAADGGRTLLLSRRSLRAHVHLTQSHTHTKHIYSNF